MISHYIDSGLNFVDFQSCVPVPVDAAAAALLKIVGVPLLVVVLPLLLHLLHPSLLVVHHEGVDSEHPGDQQCLLLQ